MARRLSLQRTPQQRASELHIEADRKLPYHCVKSVPQQRSVNDVVKLLKKPMRGKSNWRIGAVYVIEEKGSGFVKVGYTNTAALERAEEHVADCHVRIHRMYMTQGFRGAHKAEQISMKLMADHNFLRNNCACKRKKDDSLKKDGRPRCHTEWFQTTFESAVETVLLVTNWIQQQRPYAPKHFVDESGDMPKAWQSLLKTTWVESLEQWHNSQYGWNPLGWRDFFWRHEEHWTGYSVSRTPLFIAPEAPGSPRKQYESPMARGSRPSGNFIVTYDVWAHEATEISQTYLAYEKHRIKSSSHAFQSTGKIATQQVHRSMGSSGGLSDSGDQRDITPCPDRTREELNFLSVTNDTPNSPSPQSSRRNRTAKSKLAVDDDAVKDSTRQRRKLRTTNKDVSFGAKVFNSPGASVTANHSDYYLDEEQEQKQGEKQREEDKDENEDKEEEEVEDDDEEEEQSKRSLIRRGTQELTSGVRKGTRGIAKGAKKLKNTLTGSKKK